MEHLRRINKYFWKYRRLLLFGVLFITLSNYFRVLQPQVIREALDLVVSEVGMYRLYDGFDLQATYRDSLGQTLLFFAIIVVVLAILMGVFLYFTRQNINVMSRLIEYDLRKSIFEHYERLTLAFYKRNNTGDLMSRVTEDVSKVRNYVGPAILYGANLLSTFVLVIYTMLRVNPVLTFYCLIPLPFLSIGIYYVSNIINRKSEAIQKQLAHLNSVAQEVYSGIRVVKSYVREQPQVAYFGAETDEYKRMSLGLVKVDALFFPIMLLMIGASTIITVYIGGLQVVRGAITPGNIAEFVLYVNMLTWPVTSIGWIASIIQQAAASQKRINEFLNIEPEISNPRHDPRPLQGHLIFDRVSFTYPDTGIQALHDVSFELKSGQKMAIIGRTGSGKTTIADLLVRMYDVSGGTICIDGQDIREMDLANLRERIGYVPQDVFLFSDTIANNIAFGQPDADRQRIEDYARHAAVYHDIVGLTHGFDTMVGERGVTLSGGQKQRVSIARALIKQPDLLILDDSLSAVDTNTEKQILGYFSQALGQKTAIVITHRIYSLLEFDKIIVLDQGRVIESGTHQELLQNGGYYAELVEKQTMEEVDNTPTA